MHISDIIRLNTFICIIFIWFYLIRLDTLNYIFSLMSSNMYEYLWM